MAHDGQVLMNDNRIDFIGCYRPDNVTDVCRFINQFALAKPDRIYLNFGQCTTAFPNSILPLIALCSLQRRIGYDYYALLPKAADLKQRFLDYNWAYYLSPNHYKMSDDYSVPHLAVKHYGTNDEHESILQQILNLVLRTVQTPRSAIASLEWSLSEVMDNVLNHSQSQVGGFVQVAVFPNTKKLAFTVADAGRGILESLREAIPALNSDRVAIEHAVRGGVTRNKDFGQGNGLSGSLALATETSGWFRIRSGETEIVWMPPDSEPQYFDTNTEGSFHGTIVDVQLPYDAAVDVGAILTAASNTPSYSPVSYSPTDLIETRHLTEDGNAVILRMREETTGFGSRFTGQQMRIKAQNLLRAEEHLPLLIDWEGVQVIASSYADEFIGKLFVEIGPVGFMTRIRLLNLAPIVQTLIDKAIVQRTQQASGRR
jgi:anti-sigma regulatory factor (Ser/Thr protein kinase)